MRLSLAVIACPLLFAASAAAQTDGELLLVNVSDQDASFSGYTIACEAGCLDVDGWRSIGDAVAADPLGVIAALGSGALGIGEASPSANALSELNVSGVAWLAAGASWSLGVPFAGTAAEAYELIDAGVLTASFSAGANPPGSIQFVFVPEPPCWALAALIGGGLLGRHRRRLRG